MRCKLVYVGLSAVDEAVLFQCDDEVKMRSRKAVGRDFHQ